MKEKILSIIGDKIFQYGETETTNLEFLPEVVKACEANYCGMYNKTWLCPPAVGNLDELKAKYNKYKKCFTFTTKWDIEDSFDIEGMFEARKKHDKVTFFLKDKLSGEDFKILGAGGCSICEKCSYPDAPCRFPTVAIPSVEACGVQVMQLSKTLNINYINGANTVTYFSVVFYN